ncbi:NaMN:DMB phosphoribosyltransferase [Reinekea marinisedimentorum]|uniref:NaMN:DMB phosphoribosyltransferase n=2 Tax=Reinekea marinisedimentorum TaxID=230495 RepID=A0A4R3I1Z2_9GAMM|nr:NaMN:DMB phosphoribosyltransferase [Reinekea marinisedimentorum]
MMTLTDPKQTGSRWLNFMMLNAVAPITNLHQVSDAGAGEGLMQLHPTRDSELIVCGRANTLLNGVASPTPVVPSGVVTPAILVHGMLMALRKRGFKIRFHCYQLGLAASPDFSESKLDEVVIHHCPVGQEAAFVNTQLLPELHRQMRAGEQHLIAECGIGGTTFATLWMRHWLDENLTFAGSTQCPEKLALKTQLLNRLMARSRELPLEVSSFTRDTTLSDPIQRVCCALLNEPLPKLNFAGGVMMLAPIIAMQDQIQAVSVQVATTRWVMSSPAASRLLAQLPARCQLKTQTSQLNSSAYNAIRLYEQGFVTEGCGFGGIMVFAEQQGMSEQDIIENLELAVEPWAERN